jgi:hypothetical protein
MILVETYYNIPMIILSGTMYNPVGNKLTQSKTDAYSKEVSQYSYDHPVRNHAKPRREPSKTI